jgi:hypothetical protein
MCKVSEQMILSRLLSVQLSNDTTEPGLLNERKIDRVETVEIAGRERSSRFDSGS